MEVRYYGPKQPVLRILGCQRQGTHTRPVLWSFITGSNHTGVLHLWCWTTTSQSDTTKQELPPRMQGTWIDEANCFQDTATTFSKLWLTWQLEIEASWYYWLFFFTVVVCFVRLNCTCWSIHTVYIIYYISACFNKSTLLWIWNAEVFMYIIKYNACTYSV